MKKTNKEENYANKIFSILQKIIKSANIYIFVFLKRKPNINSITRRIMSISLIPLLLFMKLNEKYVEGGGGVFFI